MKDHPIIFSAPMVQALLAGRKTQTRRLAWRDPLPVPDDARDYWLARGAKVSGADDTDTRLAWMPSPWQRAQPGDRLWVRETVACGACAKGKPSHWAPSFWRREQGSPKNPSGIWYQADGLEPETQITTRGRWVPSIHMPRWASRLTLTVTEVRVQRLQEISQGDAEAEGFASIGTDDPCGWFSSLWRSLHTEAPARWEGNPEVVALTFTVEQRNIDA